MAENNLGQVAAVWIEDSEPPHKNVLWLKTINQLTSEKAGFIWNGIEWINIQGLGFYWKGEFNENTNYAKNDIVRFEGTLYIKLNYVVHTGDNPTVSADFDLFLSAATPSGVEGSVQIKDENGKFFGSNLLTWLSKKLSIFGNLYIKGNSTSVGNALEIRNANNTILAQLTNGGVFQTQNISGINGNAANFSIYYDGYASIRGIYGVQLFFGQSTNITNLTARFASNYITFFKPCIGYSIRADVFSCGVPNEQNTRDLTIQGQEASTINNWAGVSRAVLIQDGKPRPDDTSQGYDGKGVIIKNWIKQTGIDPLLVEIARFEGNKIGFHGAKPIAQQTLSSNPTKQELSDVLFNLGLVNRP